MQQPHFNNLYEIVRYNADISPSKTIIYEHELKISNKDLQLYVDKVAMALHMLGVKAGDKVAIIMSNCWQFIANLLAISKVGAIVVPVNNFFKEDEISYVLNDAHAKLLFSSSQYAAVTRELIITTGIEKIIWVGEAPCENETNLSYVKIISASYPESPGYSSTLSDTAFILYTSGTTGKPKGAELLFKNILSNCKAAADAVGVAPDQAKMLCYLPMFHAFTLTVTIILPLYLDSAIIVIRKIAGKGDFKYLLKQLLMKRCRYFVGIPDIYGVIAKAKLPWYFHWLHRVIGFISGASALPDDIYKRFSASFKRGELLQGYGITECSPVVACNLPKQNRPGSVGKPLDNYQVKIFDESMHELPVGSVGEICVHGDCVMKGYYNRPNETAAAIVNGWFKTGDIGRVDEENFIYIMDRKKDLIIHKGMNIYPREIEEILYTNEKVNGCAVIGVQDKEGSEIPVVYVEVKEDTNLSEQEIKDFIKPHLATFKLPRRVYFIEQLPRNAMGKVIKRELREMVVKER